MFLIRRFEELCLRLSNDAQIAGSIHLCGGQEAVPVGCLGALLPGDRIIATYRGHGWAIACGTPIDSLLGEILHREDGVNGGRAGSAYLTAPDHGFLGENSIVGAGVPIAVGVGLSAQLRATGKIAAVSIGDGAMNQGATHEGMAFAAALDLPVVFICENNGWSEMTPITRTTRCTDLADRAFGYGIPAAVVDGCDPEAVRAAVQKAAQRARKGDGPTLIECKTVRLMAHYNRDVEHYRTQEEKAADVQRDPLPLLRKSLIEAGLTEADCRLLEIEVDTLLDAALTAASSMPPPDPSTAPDHVYSGSTTVGNTGAGAPPMPNAPPVRMQYAEAINAALRTELEDRSEVVVYGEDVGHAGGIFGVTRRLQRDFGESRVFDTPIAESAILGSAIGAALDGMRPIVEIMWADFLLVALDQLVNQAANVRYISRGRQPLPLVVRTQQGATPGSCAQHSQSLEALLFHIPGLRVGLPSTPQDAFGMLRAAVACDDPCVIIESRALYPSEGEVHLGASVEQIGGSRVRREGSDAAILSWGSMVDTAITAAEILAGEGIEVAVLDLRWLNPLDDSQIMATVINAGGRAVIAHEANMSGGVGAELSARIHERLSDGIRPRIKRVATPDVRIPAAPVLQAALVPSVATVAEAVRSIIFQSSEELGALKSEAGA